MHRGTLSTSLNPTSLLYLITPRITPHLSIPCHLDSVSPLTQPLCWSIPCWNRWSALAGCWSVTAQPKAHQNQPVDSQGLSKMCRHHLATHSPERLPGNQQSQVFLAGTECSGASEEQHIPASVGRSRALSSTRGVIPAVLCVCAQNWTHGVRVKAEHMLWGVMR